VRAPWAILQAMLQGILQAAGPVGYYYNVTTAVRSQSRAAEPEPIAKPTLKTPPFQRVYVGMKSGSG